MLFYLDYDDGAGGRFVNAPGLLPLIGVCRRSGFDIRFITREASLLRAARSPDIGVVGISSMERILARSIAVAKRVRRLRPDVVLMIGGSGIGDFGAGLAEELFDLVVAGEAEHVLPALLRALSPGRGLRSGGSRSARARFVDGPVRKVGVARGQGPLDRRAVQRVLGATFSRHLGGHGDLQLRVGGVFVRDTPRQTVWELEEPSAEDLPTTGPPGSEDRDEAHSLSPALGSRPLESELDDLCCLPWDILAAQGWTHLEFYTQRGCRWGRCRFCSVPSREIRSLSPQKVVEIVAEAIRHGVEVISFADDLFVQRPAWNTEVLDLLLSRGVKARFRAQTMANRSVWPFLKRMRKAGFEELAFGLETLNPRRARTMVKSLNGAKYVMNARETIERTAAAGIYPTVYLILADPTSTLLEVAGELKETVDLIAEVYYRTGIAPKASYSLVMLPVTGTSFQEEFEHATESVELVSSHLQLPTEFKLSAPMAAYLTRIDGATESMPHRRENLSAIRCFLETVADVAEQVRDPRRSEIQECAASGLRLLDHLTGHLDRDIRLSARSICRELASGNGQIEMPATSLDYQRFGGYFEGVAHFYQLVKSGLEQRWPAAVPRTDSGQGPRPGDSSRAC